MVNEKKIRLHLGLQFFGEGGSAGAAGNEGGDGGTGAGGETGVNATAAVSQKKGVKANPLSNVVYGVQAKEAEVKADTVKADEAPAAEVVKTEDRNARFEELIKGEFKDLYNSRVQETVQKRLKGTKESADKYVALSPVLEILAKKYGVDANDAVALAKAIEEDDSYYEEEALERGMTVQQLKDIRKLEKEHAALKAEKEERVKRERLEKDYAAWVDQANNAKRMYPSLDLEAEVKNPQFISLLRAGIDVGTAYEVIHKDEIIPAAMQIAAKKAEQKVINNVLAGGARPSENGSSSQGATIVKSDVSKLTKQDREEIERQVAAGKKISFS